MGCASEERCCVERIMVGTGDLREMSYGTVPNMPFVGLHILWAF
jgi:hypothetical protein